MNDLLHHGILLAQRSRLEGLSRGFKGQRINTGDIVTGLLVLAGIVVVVWALSYLLTLQERRRSYTSPGRLFFSLCKAHRLRWPQWWLLWRVARSQRLRDPARLFLEPERLEPSNLGSSLQMRAAQLKELRERLFAEPEQQQDEQDLAPPETPDSRRAGTPLAPVPSTPALDIPPWPPVPHAHVPPTDPR